MIGCVGYTDTVSCMQYVQDVQDMKIRLLLILILASISIIYYVRTKHYKKLTKEFVSFKTFFFLPKWAAYIFLGFSFFFPFLLRLEVGIDEFLYFIYAFVVPVVAWLSILTFLLLVDWVVQRLGFENFAHFINSARKK